MWAIFLSLGKGEQERAGKVADDCNGAVVVKEQGAGGGVGGQS